MRSLTFREFELAGWQKIPAAYHDAFAGLTPQAARPLLDAAGVTKGVRILDVATGPGYVAAEAAKRGARATGIDFSAEMIERAREHCRDTEFLIGDAAALPFTDQTFDSVVMNFGLPHLTHPEKAVRETWRVLRQGGRVAFTVWAPPEEAIGFGAVLRAIAAHGSLEAPLPEGPPFFRFSDPAECERVLLDAGFVSPRIRRIPQVWYLDDADDLFDLLASGTVRTAGLLRAQDPGKVAAIRAAVRDEVNRYRTDDTIELPMPAVLAAADKA